MEIFQGRHSQQKVSYRQVQAVVQGGKKADLIRKAAQKHHDNVDVPDAELFLHAALQQEKTKEIKQTPESITLQEPLSFWEQTTSFFKKIKKIFTIGSVK